MAIQLSSNTASGDPFGALSWIEAILTGNLATTSAIIAVALFGLELLNGRFSLRRGAALVFGCFILFAAPGLARSLLSLSYDATATSLPAPIPAPLEPVEVKAPPAPKVPPPFDPYAGASIPTQ